MKKILITGSVGFVFSNFIRKATFDKQPYTFVGIDKIVKPSTLNNIYLNKGHTLHIGDVCDEHFIDRIFEYERPNVVIHGASETSIEDSFDNPNRFVNTNILGTQVVANASVKWGVEKFIYMSTSSVYGSSESKVTELSPTRPSTPYASSKLAGELIVQSTANCFGLNYNILRTSNNFGLRQPQDKLIPKTLKLINENVNIPIYGQGQQTRDWLYVMDHCAAIFNIIQSGKSNETYNVSSGQEYTNLEVIQQVCNTLNKGHDLMKSQDDPVKNRDLFNSIDSSKLRDLGWKPSWKFKNALAETIDWYQKNSYYLK